MDTKCVGGVWCNRCCAWYVLADDAPPNDLHFSHRQILLGVHNKRANLEVPPGEGLTPEDQQTIKADVARTRQTVDKFKTDKVQADLEKLLTVYCKRRSVKYTQGLNELIAPFFLLDMDEGDAAPRSPPPHAADSQLEFAGNDDETACLASAVEDRC